MPYTQNGILTTDKREVAVSEKWDSQTDWNAYQSKSAVEVNNGILQLSQINIPAFSDLYAQYDATKISGTDGDSITTLSNQTGSGFDLSTQGTNSSTYSSSLINGQPGLDMPFGSQLYETNTDIPQPVTFFLVGGLKNKGSSSDNQIAGGVEPRSGVLVEKSGDWRLLAGNFNNIGSSDTNLHIFSFLFNGGSSILRIDGTEIANNVGAGSDNIQKLGLNGETGGGDSPGIEFGELLCYPQDKSGIFTDVESYLADKWGFTL